MSRVLCAVADPLGPKSGCEALLPERDFSPCAQKFATRVLVVDDEPLIRWSVGQALAELGYDVTEASDARSALKVVTTTPLPFELVVMDMRLPDMRDLSLLSTVRQLLPDARLILMTAFASPDLIADAHALDATVLPKPFALEELIGLALDDAGHS